MEKTLIGRGDDHEKLIDSFDCSSKFGGMYFFLSGEAGLGKTHLVEHFIDTMKDKGQITAYVQCTSQVKGEDLYRPCVEMVNNLLPLMVEKSKPDNRFSKFFKGESGKALNIASEIMGFIPGLAPLGSVIRIGLSLKEGKKPNEIDQQLEKYKDDKVSFYADIIIGLSLIRPIIIVFDDLHWADPGTIAVIRQIFSSNLTLLNAGKLPQIMCLCTTRDLESKTDEVGKEVSKLKEFFARYDRRKEACLYYEHLLATMTEKDLISLMRYEFDDSAELSTPFTQWLVEQSAGNPLMLCNSIDVLKQHGAVNQDGNIWKDSNEVDKCSDGKWKLKGKLLSVQKTGSLSNGALLALEPLRNLSEADRRLLYCAANIGQYFTSDVLSHLLGEEESNLLWDLRRLENYGFFHLYQDIKRGLNDTYVFKFNSQLLKDALVCNLFPKQVKEAEYKIAYFYEQKIEELKSHLEILKDMSSHTLGKIKTDFERQIKNTEQELVNLAVDAKTHYIHAEDYTKALLFALEAFEHDVDLLEGLEYEEVTPIEKEIFDKRIKKQQEQVVSLIKQCYLTANHTAGISYKKLFPLDIKAHKILSTYFLIIGDYKNALMELDMADNIALHTNMDKEKKELLPSYMKLYYQSGDYSGARAKCLDVLNHLEIELEEDQEFVEDLLLEVSDVICDFESPPIGVFLLDKIIKIAEKACPDDIYWYESEKVCFLLQQEDITSSSRICNNLLLSGEELKTIKVIENLSNCVSKIYDEYLIELQCLTPIYDDEEEIDEEEYELKNPLFTYKWRLTAVDWLSEIFIELLDKPAKYNLTQDNTAECFLRLSSLCHWLIQAIESIPQEEFNTSKKNKQVYMYQQMVFDVGKKAKNILNSRFPQEKWSKRIMNGLQKVRLSQGDDAWIEEADFCFYWFSKYIPLDEAKSIFMRINDCLRINQDTDGVDIYVSWLTYLRHYILEPEGLTLADDCVQNLSDNVLPSLQTEKPSNGARIISAMIGSYYLPLKKNTEAWELLKECVRLYMQDNDIESATDMINDYAEMCSPSKKETKLLINSLAIKEDEEEEVTNVGLIEGDPYIDVNNAKIFLDKARNIDEEDADEQMQKLKYLLMAKKYAEKHELGKTILDDVYSDIAEWWFDQAIQEEYEFDKRWLQEKGITIPPKIGEGAIYVGLSLENAFKSLKINEELKDWNRVDEELERIFDIMEYADEESFSQKENEYIQSYNPPDYDHRSWYGFMGGKGRVERMIELMARKFEEMEGYNIINPKEFINPDNELTMVKEIINYLISSGFTVLLPEYKKRIESVLWPGKGAEIVLNQFK